MGGTVPAQKTGTVERGLSPLTENRPSFSASLSLTAVLTAPFAEILIKNWDFSFLGELGLMGKPSYKVIFCGLQPGPGSAAFHTGALLGRSAGASVWSSSPDESMSGSSPKSEANRSAINRHVRANDKPLVFVEAIDFHAV